MHVADIDDFLDQRLKGNFTSELREMKNKVFLQKEDYIFSNTEVKISTEHVKSHRYERHYFFPNILCRQHPFILRPQ